MKSSHAANVLVSRASLTLVTLVGCQSCASLGVLALFGCQPSNSPPVVQPSPPATSATQAPQTSASPAPAYMFDDVSTGSVTAVTVAVDNPRIIEMPFQTGAWETLRVIDSPVVPLAGNARASTVTVLVYYSTSPNHMVSAYPANSAPASSSASLDPAQPGNVYVLDTPITGLASNSAYCLAVEAPTGTAVLNTVQNGYFGVPEQYSGSSDLWGSVRGLPDGYTLYLRVGH